MFHRMTPPPASTLIASLLAFGLAAGWAWRETVHAQAVQATTPSSTITLDQVSMTEYTDEGKRVGEVGIYTDGPTEDLAHLVTGRFVIDPKSSPHPPHVHPEEEILIVASGRGEIFCDGKTTKIGPGSVMFSAPNVPHSITNEGDEPLTFYFLKWLPKPSK